MRDVGVMILALFAECYQNSQNAVIVTHELCHTKVITFLLYILMYVILVFAKCYMIFSSNISKLKVKGSSLLKPLIPSLVYC
jgi:hypothetical protein